MTEKLKTILIIIFAALLVISCGNSDKIFQADFDEAVKGKQGEALITALKELDAKYEEKLMLKVNLSALYLSAGDLDNAVIYLKEGLPLADKSKDKGEKYMFYANYAEYLLRDEKYSDCEKYARTALENAEEDSLGVSMTLAKAMTAQKKYSEAYNLFKESWKTMGLLFSEEDINAFLFVLAQVPSSSENLVIHVTLLDELKIKNPSINKIGIEQARILEKAGAPLSALFAVLSEVETARYKGLMDNEAVERNLNAVAARFDNPEFKETGQAGIKIIEGYADFINERWDRADAVFTQLQPELPVTFYYYLKLASRIETGFGTKEDFAAFITLERNYSSMQGYYYHFWRGLKKAGTDYNRETAEPALRGCIIASPYTAYALQSRVELGSLYGIEGGEKILLPEELVFYYQGIISGAPVEILEPVADFLSMDDNVFVKDAMVLMKEAFTNETISEWFKKKSEASGNENLKKRVLSLLS